jgi:hypothetical protein
MGNICLKTLESFQDHENLKGQIPKRKHRQLLPRNCWFLAAAQRLSRALGSLIWMRWQKLGKQWPLRRWYPDEHPKISLVMVMCYICCPPMNHPSRIYVFVWSSSHWLWKWTCDLFYRQCIIKMIQTEIWYALAHFWDSPSWDPTFRFKSRLSQWRDMGCREALRG